jgi:hypothetical protein
MLTPIAVAFDYVEAAASGGQGIVREARRRDSFEWGTIPGVADLHQDLIALQSPFHSYR